VERSIGLGTAVRVTYDGSHGSDLGYSINLNQVPANTACFNAVKASAPFPIWAHITDYVNRRAQQLQRADHRGKQAAHALAAIPELVRLHEEPLERRGLRAQRLYG